MTSVQMNLAIADGNDPDDPATDAYTAPADLRYEIGALPPATDGIFYLGNPTLGGATPVTAGQILSQTQLKNLYFQATNNFVGTTTLEYAAIDKLGLKDATPGVITISSSTGEPPDTFDDRQTITPGEANPLDTPAAVGVDPDGTVERVKITQLPDTTDGVLYIGAVSPANLVTLNQELTLEQFASLVFDAADTFNGGTFKYAAIDNTNLVDPEAATFTLDSPPETKNAIGKLNAGDTIQLVSGAMTTPLTEGSDPEDGTPTQYRIDVSTINATQGTLYLGDPTDPTNAINPAGTDLTINADQLDDLFFVAAAGFTGDVIEYVAIDSIGGEDPTPGKIYLNPPGTNIPPEAKPEIGVVPESGTLPLSPANGFDLGGNDPDGFVASFRITELPMGGTLSLNGTPVTTSTVISPSQIDDLIFTATTPASFGGTTFKYAVIDNESREGAPATVELGTPPTTINQLQTILPNSTNTLTFPTGGTGINGNDAGDRDGTVVAFRIDTLTDAFDGVLYLGDPLLNNRVVAGQELTLAEMATLQFVATPDFNGSGFTYSAIDEDGNPDLSPATYTLNSPPETDDASGVLGSGEVLQLSLPPTANPTTTPYTIDPLEKGSDPDVGGAVEFYEIKTNTISEGILYLGDPAGTGVNVTTLPAGSAANTVRISKNDFETLGLYFQADGDFVGGVEIEYYAIDNLEVADSTPGKIYLNPPNTNLPPDTYNAGETAFPGVPLAINNIPNSVGGKGAGGTDPDTIGNLPVSYKLNNLPAGGKLYLGAVNPLNEVTTATIANPLTSNQLANLIFVASDGFTGATINYFAIDEDGADDSSSPGVITLNAPPDTTDNAYRVDPGNTITLNVANNFSGGGLDGNDPDRNGVSSAGDPTSYTIKTLPPETQGTLKFNGNPVEIGDVIPHANINDLIFTAAATFTGTTFTYAANDQFGAQDPTPATVRIDPTNFNEPPETQDDRIGLLPGDVVRLTLLDSGNPNLNNGTDPDGNVTDYRIGTPETSTRDPNKPADTRLFPYDRTDGILYLLPLNTTEQAFQDDIARLPENRLLLIPSNEVVTGQIIPANRMDDLVFASTGSFNGTEFKIAAIDDGDAADITPATVELYVGIRPETFDAIENIPLNSKTKIVGLDQQIGGFDDLEVVGDQLGEVVSYKIYLSNTTLNADNAPLLDPNDLLGANSNADGTLFYTTVAGVRTLVTDGLEIPASQIGTLEFESTGTFNGAKFKYAAIDNSGLIDVTPATVFLNAPPNAENDGYKVIPGGVIELKVAATDGAIGDGVLGGTDPNAPDANGILEDDETAVELYRVDTLPAAAEGTIYLRKPGLPDRAIVAGDDLTPSELQQIIFVATDDFTVGETVTFTYTSIDRYGLKDASPATVTITSVADTNLPPQTNNGEQNITPGTTTPLQFPIELDPAADEPGTDPDGTVEKFRIDTVPDAVDGILYIGSVNNANVVNAMDELTPEQLKDLIFVATENFNGGTFTYTAFDNRNAPDSDGITGTFTLNAPPNTDDAIGFIVPGEMLRLNSNPTGSSTNTTTLDIIKDGSDPDGTVEFYEFNPATFPVASQGVFFVGDPNAGGVAINGINNFGDPAKPYKIPVAALGTDLANLYFVSTAAFNGGVNVKYAAIDNKNFADPTPGTIRLEKPGNLDPETDDAEDVVPPNGELTLTNVVFGGTDPEDGTLNSTTVDQYQLFSLPTNGTLYTDNTKATPIDTAFLNDLTQNSFTLNELKALTFVATNPDTFTGDTFQYQAVDSNTPEPGIDQTPATVTLNPSPKSTHGFETIFADENTPLDVPPGTPTGGTTIAQYTIDTVPGTGTLYIGDPSLGRVVSNGDTLTPAELTALYFDPPANYGGGSFTYTPIDSNGSPAPTATFRLNVPPDTDSAQGIVNPGETIDLDNNANNTGTATMSNLVVAGADPNQVGGSGEDDAVGGTVVPASVNPLTDGAIASCFTNSTS
ncbi:MAG: hypothetical protein HC795_15245 [Coleofasciculaceae cyanobacterium RL_1_1]|nr:hypothetical protein [Coleofasciculaceae cyanobacterium RL_1_1]